MEFLFISLFGVSYAAFIGVSIFLLTGRNRQISFFEFGISKIDSAYLIPLAFLLVTFIFAALILRDHPIIKAFYPPDNNLINNLQDEIKKLKESNQNKGRNLCTELEDAKYFQFQKDYEYIFTDKDFTKDTGVRAIAIDGSWNIDKEKSCTSDKGDQYIVGKDISKHRIEIKQDNGEFKPVGYATSLYDSKVHISEEGKFGLRSIMKPDLMKFIPLKDVPSTEEILRKVCLYDKHRRQKHNLIDVEESDAKKSQPCITTMGKSDHRIVMAFICSGYTRVMFQNNLQSEAQDINTLPGNSISCPSEK
ncbi:hypothetical protein R2103_04295 [Nitrosomonas sp. Is24]|uniref:hypothetical protein n=1 Tax=Nitrosomonas sp. Is24 TaxID=3080533 RepID=UPI00294AA0F9|nr:hypothetical protein [Nitrosomonas sp. Is24]MDV6340988.1 hypothetical protein [Nitrosomonas sp. Is24]